MGDFYSDIECSQDKLKIIIVSALLASKEVDFLYILFVLQYVLIYNVDKSIVQKMNVLSLGDEDCREGMCLA
jgi:hypothetical protein